MTQFLEVGTGRRFPLVHHATPWLANKDRTMHWSRKAELVAEWRQAFMVLAREARVPHLELARIEVTHYRTAGRWPDVGACAPALKAALDGVVDAGVLDDDDPVHVVAITYAVMQMPAAWKRPFVTGALGLVIVEMVRVAEVVR